MCLCVCLLRGAVSSCVARRCSLFFVCRSSLAVSCRLSFVVLCSVGLCCCVRFLLSLRAFVGVSACAVSVDLVLSYLLVACGIKWSFFFLSLFLFSLRLSHGPVCRFKTSFVCTGTARTCVSTYARGACTHGDVLSLHTRVFAECHTTHHTAQQHTTIAQHTTPTRPQHPTPTPTNNTHKCYPSPKTVNDVLCVWLCGFDFSCFFQNYLTRIFLNFQNYRSPSLKKRDCSDNFSRQNDVKSANYNCFKNYFGNHFGRHGNSSTQQGPRRSRGRSLQVPAMHSLPTSEGFVVVMNEDCTGAFPVDGRNINNQEDKEGRIFSMRLYDVFAQVSNLRMRWWDCRDICECVPRSFSEPSTSTDTNPNVHSEFLVVPDRRKTVAPTLTLLWTASTCSSRRSAREQWS